MFSIAAACKKHARKKKKSFERTQITALLFALTPRWVLGEGVLRCIATALRGLGHQSRREVVVRSDKFVEQYGIRQYNQIMGYVDYARYLPR